MASHSWGHSDHIAAGLDTILFTEVAAVGWVVLHLAQRSTSAGDPTSLAPDSCQRYSHREERVALLARSNRRARPSRRRPAEKRGPLDLHALREVTNKVYSLCPRFSVKSHCAAKETAKHDARFLYLLMGILDMRLGAPPEAGRQKRCTIEHFQLERLDHNDRLPFRPRALRKREANRWPHSQRSLSFWFA